MLEPIVPPLLTKAIGIIHQPSHRMLVGTEALACRRMMSGLAGRIADSWTRMEFDSQFIRIGNRH